MITTTHTATCRRCGGGVKGTLAPTNLATTTRSRIILSEDHNCDTPGFPTRTAGLVLMTDSEPTPIEGQGPDCGCTDINNLCTKHQTQYQNRWGRASNE